MSERTFTLRIKSAEPDTGYVVHCVEVPNAISQGETEEEAIVNGLDALSALLSLELPQKRRRARIFRGIVGWTA